MTSRRTPLLAGIATVALLLAGCGDDDGGGGDAEGRPTAEEVAEALPVGSMDEEQLACLAQAFVDSDISDEGLRSIVDAGTANAEGLSAADSAAVQTAAGEAVACSIADDLPSTPSSVPGSEVPSSVPGSEPATTAAG
ncbi:MAG TPA: hypothetical protein VFU19_12110 [Iamia sp.]|nr:hypothetical protein [Iamia sp.]